MIELKKQYFWSFAHKETFDNSHASGDLVNLDLMPTLEEYAMVFDSADECLSAFDNPDYNWLNEGEYVVFRFFCENYARMMGGAIAAAIGNSDNSPFPVILKEHFVKIHSK